MHLRRLWKFSYCIPFPTKILLVKSLLTPHFLYGDVLNHPLNFICKNRLQIIFNSCIRFIYNLRRFDHISKYSNVIFGCPLLKYLDYRSWLFLFKLRKSGTPQYLFNLLTSASLRTLNFIIPRYTSKHTCMSMFVYSVQLWNDLPLSAKRATSISKFKKLFGYFPH